VARGATGAGVDEPGEAAGADCAGELPRISIKVSGKNANRFIGFEVVSRSVALQEAGQRMGNRALQRCGAKIGFDHHNAESPPKHSPTPLPAGDEYA